MGRPQADTARQTQCRPREKGVRHNVNDLTSSERDGATTSPESGRHGDDYQFRINGLQTSLTRKSEELAAERARAETERARADDLAIELDALRASGPPEREPRMDPNNPRRQRPAPADPMDALKDASWEAFGMEQTRSR